MNQSSLFFYLLLSAVPLCGAEDLGKRQPFRGKLIEPGLVGSQIGQRPLVGHATSLEMDEKGRVFLVESERMGGGVVDIRGAPSLVRGDFQLKTVDERRKQLLGDPSFAAGFFTKKTERVARLVDLNGDGVPDQRTEFAAGMNDVGAGIAFSALALDGKLYVCCLPDLLVFVDKNDDGVADYRMVLHTGFGVRTSMKGHDLHGIIAGPDGRLYFSMGDRGYHVQTQEGRTLADPSSGAVFRCDPDGANLEVYHRGLRNPQELAFDSQGNLFTFDNTGDIGDLARAVYVQEGADAGWCEEHQAAHQYRSRLDFTDLAVPTSIWVAEKMSLTRCEEQPQWILPPVANVGHGPSGVAYLTGESLPPSLRESFAVTNYRGDPARSELLSVRFAAQGASFRMVESRTIMSGVANSDVLLGYDGRLYVVDFGGGWVINDNASLQVMEAPEHVGAASVKQVQQQFAAGFAKLETSQLADYLQHPDQRMRQRAQFQLVKRGDKATLQAAVAPQNPLQARLHGLWGLGQLARKDDSLLPVLSALTEDADAEIQANACRTLGDFSRPSLDAVFLKLLGSPSQRVASFAALALGRRGRLTHAPALWQVLEKNAGADVGLRHAAISALERLKDAEGAVAKKASASVELRLAAVILLRKLEDARVGEFVSDSAPLVQVEALRAAYDKHLRPALPAVAALAGEASRFPVDTIQWRILFANYWLGTPAHAQAVLGMARDTKLSSLVREAALRALLRWNDQPTMDPVTAFYRPVEKRSVELRADLEVGLREMLAAEQGEELALALDLAKLLALPLNAADLEPQAMNAKLTSSVRQAAIKALVKQNPEGISSLLEKLKDNKDAEVAALMLELCFQAEQPDRIAQATALLASPHVPVVRTAIRLLAKATEGKATVAQAFTKGTLVADVQLDAFLALQSSDDPKLQELATAFAADPAKLQQLTLQGGSAAAGALVFQNQGGCKQCHQLQGQGGVQGPTMDEVAVRLSKEKLLESLVNPGATIAEGYGLFTVMTKKGEALAGRLGQETDAQLELILPTGEVKTIAKPDITERAGPYSAMPALALTLPPAEVRDLIAYLHTLRVKWVEKH